MLPQFRQYFATPLFRGTKVYDKDEDIVNLTRTDAPATDKLAEVGAQCQMCPELGPVDPS